MQKREWDRVLRRIAEGDEEAFEELYKNSSRGVYAFLYSYLGNKEDTEDALQDTYLKVRYNILHYKSGTDGRAWVLEIAKNTALNELRRKSSNRTEELDARVTSPTFAYEGDTSGVTYAMQKVLTEEERQIIVLHVLWGYKHREIAKMLNVPTGTITSKYKRAVEKLKTFLKEVKQ